jgi:hypothetical protein
MKIGGPFPRYAKLLAWGALGVGLIAAKPLLSDVTLLGAQLLLEVAKDVGIALVVASFLALTIDRWFSADLHQDVFEAVIGYIPPEEFKEEIRSLLRHNFICERHVITFALTDLGSDGVRLTTTVERTLRNITTQSAPLKAYLHIDDWGADIEKSQIIDCYLLKDGQRFEAQEKPGGESRILFSTDNVQIGPNMTAKSISKCTEIKRRNDEASFIFGAPTKNPEIVVNIPEVFKFTAGFGPQEPLVDRAAYGDRHTLTGMYFPGQRMTLRWWPARTS